MLGTINLYGQPGPVAIEINNKGWNHLLTTIAELVGIKKGIPQFSLFRRFAANAPLSRLRRQLPRRGSQDYLASPLGGSPAQRGWGCIPAALPMTSSRQKACDSIGPLHIETRPVYFFSYSFMSTYPLALRFPVSSFSRYIPWSSGAKPGRMFAVSTKSRK